MTSPSSSADLLRSWRERLDLSQAGAARTLGLSLRTLQGWEAGREPVYPELLRLALIEAERRTAQRAGANRQPREAAE